MADTVYDVTGGSAVKNPPGLDELPESMWPRIAQGDLGKAPIDMLVPGTDAHQRVLAYLNKRIFMSERRMRQFYTRWRMAERRVQIYINQTDYEALLKQDNQDGNTPKAVSIVVPYCYSTQTTIVTYLAHTFLGRRPIFQVSTNKAECVESAANMEMVLQYNADHTRLQMHFMQALSDSQLYGVGILRCSWQEKKALRTVWKSSPGVIGKILNNKQKTREERLVYQGNDVASIDPFLFFPDPRVTMSEVNKRGEFVFWRCFDGKHALKREEAAGRFKWVDYAQPMPKGGRVLDGTDGTDSARAILSGGQAQPGQYGGYDNIGSEFYQIDQGTIDLIPAELGLSPKRTIERWLFTWINKSQIVQAEPFEADHGQHPVSVFEPYSLGYAFGQPGLHDYIGDMQDTMSWFINSHIWNVRTALNNMFVVDPSRVELQDLKNPAPGKIIRLKQAAYGSDVNEVLKQLQTVDVTKSNVEDLQLLVKLADAISAVNDNVRGQQDPGGRKTATEVRTSGEAAASRLAYLCRKISSQGVVDLTEQMVTNLQQGLSDEFYIDVVGQNAKPLRVTPEQLVGDFFYPINDGTLPLDRVAMLDVWQQILGGVAKDPELRQTFSLPKMFEWAAELAGARNITEFKNPGNINPQMQVQPTAQVQEQAEKGNVVPLGSNAGGMPQSPRNRLQ